MFAEICETLKITSINSSLKPLEWTGTLINASQTACPWLLKLLKIPLKQKTATAKFSYKIPLSSRVVHLQCEDEG